MKIFYLPSNRKTFNHYLLSNNKLTVFTFGYSEDDAIHTSLEELTSFLSQHGDMVFPLDNGKLPKALLGSNLNSSLEGVFDCIGRQTLDLSIESSQNASLVPLGVGERSDCASWVFPVYGDAFPPPYNRFVQTSVSKSGTARMTSRDGHFVAQLCVPFADSLITDETNSLLLKPGSLGFSISGTDVEPAAITMEQLRSHTGGWNPFPTMELSAPATCGTDGVDVSVSLKDSNGDLIDRSCTVYFECDSGYLSKRKAQLVSGVATTKFIPLGLNAGDLATIKCGYKVFTGVVSQGVQYVV